MFGQITAAAAAAGGGLQAGHSGQNVAAGTEHVCAMVVFVVLTSVECVYVCVCLIYMLRMCLANTTRGTP